MTGSSRPKAKAGTPMATPTRKTPKLPTIKADPDTHFARGTATDKPGVDGTKESPVRVDSSGEESYKPTRMAKRVATLATAPSNITANDTTRKPKRKMAPSTNIPNAPGQGANQWLQVDGQSLESSSCDNETGKPTLRTTSSRAAGAQATDPAQAATGAGTVAATADTSLSAGKPPSTPRSAPSLFGGPSPIYSTSLSGPTLQTPEKTSTFEDVMSSGVSGVPSKKRKAILMSPSEYHTSVAASKLNIRRLSTHGKLIHGVVETTLDLFSQTSDEFLVELDQYRGLLYPLATEMVMAMEQKRANLFHSRIRIQEGEKDGEKADERREEDGTDST